MIVPRIHPESPERKVNYKSAPAKSGGGMAAKGRGQAALFRSVLRAAAFSGVPGVRGGGERA